MPLKKHISLILFSFGLTTGSFGQFSSPKNISNIDMPNTNLHSCVTFDSDIDGDLDVVSLIFTTGPNYLLGYYENLGGGRYASIDTMSTYGTGQLDTADIDNDGLIDLVITKSYDSLLYWKKNLGSNNFSNEQTISDTVVNSNFMMFKDVNNDGLPEAFFTSDGLGNEFIGMCFNLGGGIFGNAIVISTTISQNPYSGLDINDMDNDGDLDLLYSIYNTNEINWLENDGSGNFSTLHIISSVTNFPFRVKSSDLDNDGDNDVIITWQNFGEFIGWFQNDGSGNFTNVNPIDTTGARIGDLIDLDTDGDIDIVAYDNFDSTVVWYENNGTGGFLEKKLISNWQDDPVKVSCTDMNSDGNLEVIVGASSVTKIAWYENLGNGFFGDQHVISGHCGAVKVITIGDLNGDGDKDVVSGSSMPAISIFENFGNVEFEFQTTLSYAPIRADGLFSVDIDGDGDLDLLASKWLAGIVEWYENDGSGNFVNNTIITQQAGNPSMVGASDLDQDGDQDVFWTQSGWTATRYVVWHENLGSGIFGQQDTLAIFSGSSFTVVAEDLDMDGDDDIFYSNGNVGISIIENLGSGNFAPEIIAISSSVDPKSFDIEDLDNDGLKDIIVVSTGTSSIEWYKNLGGFTFGGIQNINSALNEPWGVKCSDFDSDGDFDIATVSDNDLTVAWFENFGNGSFGPKQVIHSGYGYHYIETADMDNDFDEDILAAGYFPGVVVWFENFNFHPVKISGRVFVDVDQNGINDSTDLGMNQVIVGSNPSSDYSYSFGNGDYSMIFSDSTGVYLISPNIPQYWNLTTDSVSYTILVDSNGTALDSLDFGFYPDSLIYDMNLDIVGGHPTCDDTINYWAYWENIGTTMPSGIIKITLDDSLQFINSIIPPDSISGNVVYWSFDSLSYFSFISLDFEVGTPNFMNAGDTVISYFELVILDSLYNPVDTLIDSLVQIITCAYDPNDKISDPIGVGLSGFVDPSLSTVEYIIRFQNTGTDTAQHVVIKDAVDPNLDWSTLTFLSASHQVQTIVDNSGNVNFNFYNIFLPDSNVDKQGSQGFVKYKIDLLPAVPVGTSILNSAEIYFDQNPPVITNTKILTLFDCQQVLAGMIFPSSSCENETVVGTIHDDSDSQYSWEFLGIDTLHGQSIQWLASQSGPINMKLSVNNQFCLHDTTVQIQIFPEIPLTQDPDAFKCPLDSVLVYNNYEYGAGVYYDTLQSVNGCDSIMMKEVFEYSSYLVDLGDLQVCSNDSVLIFNEYQYLIGTYYDTLQTIDGCDSILFHDLSVNFYDSENDGSVSICLGDSAFIYGEYKLIQGVYFDSLVNIEGCDSIHYQELFVNPLPTVNFNSLSSDTLCTYSGPINLSATPSGGSFSGNGVSASQFDPNTAGNGDHYIYYSYTDGNNCSSTDSALIHVGDCLGIHETQFSNVTIYPNPFKESTTISFGQELNGDYQLTIVDALGKQVYLKDNVTGNALQISRGELAKGSYFLSLTQISSGEKVFSSKLLIE